VTRLDVADTSAHTRATPTGSPPPTPACSATAVSVFVNDGRQHLRMQPPAYDLIKQTAAGRLRRRA
jgi:hypothetical protein